MASVEHGNICCAVEVGAVPNQNLPFFYKSKRIIGYYANFPLRNKRYRILSAGAMRI